MGRRPGSRGRKRLRRGREDDRRPADRAVGGLRAWQLRDEEDGAPGRAHRVALAQGARRRGLHRQEHDLHPAHRGQPTGEAGQPGGVRGDEDGQGLAGALEDAHLLRQLLGEARGPGLRLGARHLDRRLPRRGRQAPRRALVPLERREPGREPVEEGLLGRGVVERVEPRLAHEGGGGAAHLGVVHLVLPPAVEPRHPLAHERRPLADLGHHRAAQAQVHVQQALAGEARRGRGHRRVHEAGDRHLQRLRDPEQQPQLPVVVDARDREHDLVRARLRLAPQGSRGGRGRGRPTRGLPGTAARAAPRRGATRSRSPRAEG